MKKRSRRTFSKEYKAEVVTLIRQGNKTIGTVCRDLELPETAVRRWVKQADIDLGEGPSGALTTAEREELSELRKRVKTLEMEREILKNCRGRLAPPSGRATPTWISLCNLRGAAASLMVPTEPVEKHGPGVAADF